MVKEFSGILDGGGHTIKNYVVPSISDSAVGFFGVNKGTIKNIAFVNCEITFAKNPDVSKNEVFFFVGLVCGENMGTISNVLVQDCLIGKCQVGVYTGAGHNHTYYLHGGFICGQMKQESSITECGVIGSSIHSVVQAGDGGSGYSLVGGIAGRCQSGTIVDCYSYGNTLKSTCVGICVLGGHDAGMYHYVGGITGSVMSAGSISNCLSCDITPITVFESTTNARANSKDPISPYVDGIVSNCFVDRNYLPSEFSSEIWDKSVNPPVIKSHRKYTN